MTYKEFLQALADAYKATQDEIMNADAFMCIVIQDGKTWSKEESIVRKELGFSFSWANGHLQNMARKLRTCIETIEFENDCAWLEWAQEKYPNFATNHEIRAHWLQLQADQA